MKPTFTTDDELFTFDTAEECIAWEKFSAIFEDYWNERGETDDEHPISDSFATSIEFVHGSHYEIWQHRSEWIKVARWLTECIQTGNDQCSNEL